jgi:Fe2+ or Zn2+ uptake regulation protein
MSVPRADAQGELRATVAERLREANQRATSNRWALVEALAAADRPLTIPEILDSAGALAQSSVYRNLVVLESVGVVHRIVTGDEHARYELASDLTAHHHHLVCVQCGSVADVATSARFERAVTAEIDAIEKSTGFRAEDHRVDVVGRCARCVSGDLAP